MKIWNFKVFIAEKGSNEIDAWLNDLPPGAKAKIKKRITYLEITKRWGRPYAAKLKGTNNIWEIRVGFDNIQYRPLGCFGPKDGEFTLLIGATEKGGRFEPVHAIKTAEKRRSLVLQDERYIDEYR